MRIRFAPPSSSDAAAIRELSARADSFFAQVVERTRENPALTLTPAGRRDLERVLKAAAEVVSAGLMVEVDANDDGLEVALSPTEDSGLEPLLATVLERAPAASGIRFVRHRSDRCVAEAMAEVRERLGVDLSGARLRIGFSRGHLLEVVVHSDVFSSTRDERGLDAANLLVARLIGDELFDDWVGAVDIAPVPRAGPLKLLSKSESPEAALLPPSDALPAVEAAVRGLYAGLSDAPYRTSSHEAKWTLLEIEPGVELDYADQDDVALKSTRVPEAMKCFLEGGRFSSKRFSRRGEFFVYVKTDAREKSADERHALRVLLEEAVAKALVAHTIGCVVGAGLGVRYVYIDLVLEHLDHGVRLVRETLRELDVDRRSWILFCDSALSYEWLGIWDDTPPPPAR